MFWLEVELHEMKNILLIEDEPNVAAFIKKGLDEMGYDVLVAYDGQTGMDLLSQKLVDIIILDVILPGQNGLRISEKIRNSDYKDTPILMLTALGTTDNIVNGLSSGADDYMVKPFKFKELVARLEALARRKNLTVNSSQKIRIGDIELDRDSKTVKRSGKEINLTHTEYRLLEYFMRNRNRVLSRIDILENVWDVNFNMATNVVDVYVNYLRKKLDKGSENKLISTVIGMGYVMKDSVSS